MIHKWEIGQFHFSLSKAENFSIDEVVIAHIVDLYPTVVILFEEVNDILLAVPEKLIEAFSGQTHRNHSIRDVAKVQIELAVLVAVSVP